MNSTSNHFTGTSNHHTGKLIRSAAVLGIAIVGSLSAVLVGSAATAPVAGAIPLCPKFTTCPPVTPTTVPRVGDPTNGTVDPGTGTPPTTTPPSTPPSTPPTTPTNGGSNTNNANTGSDAGNEDPVPAAEAASVDETKATTSNPASSDGGGSLPIIAIVGGIAALGAAGTGLYLRYGRRA